jgi:RNA polymerase-binding transcription factor DksA
MDSDRARSLLEGQRAALRSLDLDASDSSAELSDREQVASIAGLLRVVDGDIERALRKLATGRYGTCEACGEPIAEERLEMLPATRFCVRDEERWEIDAAVTPGDLAREPGWRELDQLPEEDVDLPVHSNEELAIHVEETGAWPDEELLAPEPTTSDDEEDVARAEPEDAFGA